VIELVPYDPAWPIAFAREAERLRAALGPLARRIDHVGSTSVPGLSAKPVIDVQIEVLALRPLASWNARFAALGYVHHPAPEDDRYPFFHRPALWPHTHHVHLCEPGCAIARATLALRDLLREDAEARAAYAAEKARLAQLHVGDDAKRREAYAEAKSPFLGPLIERALALGHPRA
jgi:GrpB-like predicted nucleotidyltransferase (UPF0157 family)